MAHVLAHPTLGEELELEDALVARFEEEEDEWGSDDGDDWEDDDEDGEDWDDEDEDWDEDEDDWDDDEAGWDDEEEDEA